MTADEFMKEGIARLVMDLSLALKDLVLYEDTGEALPLHLFRLETALYQTWEDFSDSCRVDRRECFK